MPELPEVETIVNQLRSRLLGRRIVSAWVGWERIVDRPSAEEFCQRLNQRIFAAARRRGKFLLFPFHSGDVPRLGRGVPRLAPPEAGLGRGVLLVHLRMTGNLLLQPSSVEPDRHTHAVLTLDDGQRLHYRDVRKLGRLYLVDDPEEVVGRLGPEPLAADFDAEALAARLAGRRARVKSLLLDQRVLAGLGNIYADEALFRAGIHPLRLGENLSAGEIARLHAAIRGVLREAISAGGTTLRDYRSAMGQPGEFQERLQVVRRHGEPCPRCGTPLERIRVGGRSTHFCPRCQPVGGA